jgi:uncharacterized protein YndB with AHSA1/START domain
MTDATNDETRAIELDVEVPGTPEQVWDAVATGPGIGSWFVPAEVDGREGGKVTLHFGAAGDDVATIEVWDPPHRVVARSDEEHRGVFFTTEYRVEPNDDGETCTVWLVQDGFGEDMTWDAEIEQTERGWEVFLHNLRLYRTFFPQQYASPVSGIAATAGPRTAAWAKLAEALGLPTEMKDGEPVDTTSVEGAPQLVGVVDRVVDRVVGGDAPLVTLMIEQPLPGYAILGADGDDNMAFVNLSAYLFGDLSGEIADREQPRWQEWVSANFPPADPYAEPG